LPDLREISIGHGIAADALLPGLMEMARLFDAVSLELRNSSLSNPLAETDKALSEQE
jgi:hypothetical protein